MSFPILYSTSGDSNGIRTHNHLVRKQTLNHLTKLSKSLSFRLRTKWLWVWMPLLSLKPRIWRLLRARSSLTFRKTVECRFILKLVPDMIITYSKSGVFNFIVHFKFFYIVTARLKSFVTFIQDIFSEIVLWGLYFLGLDFSNMATEIIENSPSTSKIKSLLRNANKDKRRDF